MKLEIRTREISSSSLTQNSRRTMYRWPTTLSRLSCSMITTQPKITRLFNERQMANKTAVSSAEVKTLWSLVKWFQQGHKVVWQVVSNLCQTDDSTDSQQLTMLLRKLTPFSLEAQWLSQARLLQEVTQVNECDNWFNHFYYLRLKIMQIFDDYCDSHNQNLILICKSCPARPRLCNECIPYHTSHTFLSLADELKKEARVEQTLNDWANLDRRV